MSMKTKQKFRKAEQEDKKQENIPEHEIRITLKRNLKFFLIRAAELMLRKEKPCDFVILTALANAIPTALIISELIRRRIKNLHIVSKIDNIKVEDVWEPIEEGLDKVVEVRVLPLLKIKLTRNPDQNDKSDAGYQKPLDEEVKEFTLDEIKNYRQAYQGRGERYEGSRGRGGRGRGFRGRGGRGFRGRGRGRGSFRGRGGRGRDYYDGDRSYDNRRDNYRRNNRDDDDNRDNRDDRDERQYSSRNRRNNNNYNNDRRYNNYDKRRDNDDKKQESRRKPDYDNQKDNEGGSRRRNNDDNGKRRGGDQKKN